ncbi:MAG: TAXI family TRAP transporter solute-binding subunit [Peptococcia bacterium]
MRFGGSSTSTWIYSFCVAISELVNQELDDVQLNVQATAGSSAHYGMLEKDQIDLGSGSTYIDSLPYNSLAPYTAKNDTFKSALVCSVSFGQVCVPEDSDVQKMSDLSGKKIGIGGRGSPTSMMAELVMKELGIEADTVTSTPSEMVEDKNYIC